MIMASKSTLVLVLVGVMGRLISAQWGNNGWGNFGQQPGWPQPGGQPGIGGGLGVGGGVGGGIGGGQGIWGNNRNTQRYFTCIGKNTNGDEMRVTFTQADQQDRWQINRWFNPQRIQMDAVVRVSGQSQTAGQFQLVITRYGRVEDGCSSQALGRIVDNFQGINFFQPRESNSQTGVLGSPFVLRPNQGHTSSGIVRGFEALEELNGRGLALCLSMNIRNGMCQDIIPLCGKIGRDSASATSPIASPFNQFGQSQMGGMGQMGSMGQMGGMGQLGGVSGVAGMPMGQPMTGLNQGGGLPGQQNGGLPGSPPPGAGLMFGNPAGKK